MKDSIIINIKPGGYRGTMSFLLSFKNKIESVFKKQSNPVSREKAGSNKKHCVSAAVNLGFLTPPVSSSTQPPSPSRLANTETFSASTTLFLLRLLFSFGF